MTNKQPAWGYRLKDGKIESRLFPTGLPSRGWADSPAKVKGVKDGDRT